MKFDHTTIVAKDIEGARHFFSIVGLSEGPCPPFQVRGYWLYADERPVIHLVDTTISAIEGRGSARIDRIAFRAESPVEWAALIERLRVNSIYYEIEEVPDIGKLQLFVSMAPGLVIEFSTTMKCRSDTI